MAKRIHSDAVARRATLAALCREVGACPAAEVELGRGALWPSGVASLDAAAGGGLPRNTLSEIVEPSVSRGGTLILHRLLGQVREQGCFGALVDGADNFAPECLDAGVLRQLYWVRCRSVEMALRAVDLLASDGNFGLLVLDLRRNDAGSLARVPSKRWFRLQRALQKGNTTGLVLSSFPVATGAVLRLQLKGNFTLKDSQLQFPECWDRIRVEPLGSGMPARLAFG